MFPPDPGVTLQWPTINWSPFGFCGPQLSSSWVSPRRTAGFIGFGRIAQATLTRLLPFGYTTCLYATRADAVPDPESDAALARKLGIANLRRAPLEEIARESDVVFVLAPGGPATHHVVDEAFLKQMKRSAVLVNTARGTLVDSDALKKALDEKWIWGAGLDVVEGEPFVGLDHPLVKHPRCVRPCEGCVGVSLIVLFAIAQVCDHPTYRECDDGDSYRYGHAHGEEPPRRPRWRADALRAQAVIEP